MLSLDSFIRFPELYLQGEKNTTLGRNIMLWVYSFAAFLIRSHLLQVTIHWYKYEITNIKIRSAAAIDIYVMSRNMVNLPGKLS